MNWQSTSCISCSGKGGKEQVPSTSCFHFLEMKHEMKQQSWTLVSLRRVSNLEAELKCCCLLSEAPKGEETTAGVLLDWRWCWHWNVSQHVAVPNWYLACSLLRMHSSLLELGCICACWLHPSLPLAPHPDQTFLLQYLDKKLLNCGRVRWTAAALFSCFTSQKNVL